MMSRFGIGLGLLSLLLAASCGQEVADLRIANGPDIEVLDPQIANSTGAARLFQAIFEPLTRLDPHTMELRPGLALSWQALDEGQRWRFQLRPDLRWSDGQALTTDDVRDSWLRLAAPETGAGYADWMTGAEVQSDAASGVVEVRFPQPVPTFDLMCSYHALAPIPPSLRRATPGSLPDPLPCSGPFQLEERRIRDRIRLQANAHYWNAGAVGLNSVEFLTLDSQFTALNLFLQGEVHYVPSAPPLAVPGLLKDYADAFQPEPQWASYFLRFQVRDSPLKEPSLRMALVQAIDRERLAAQVGGGRRAAVGLVPDFLDGYRPPPAPPHDAAEARAQLELAREHFGGEIPRLEYLFPSNEINRGLAEALQQQWREVLGLEVALVNLESRSFRPLQRSLEYQLSHSSWIGDYLDPLTFLELFESSNLNNRTGFDDPEYDRLIRAARREPQREPRYRLLRDAEARLLQAGIVLPLLTDVSHELIRPELMGWPRNARGVVDWTAVRWPAGGMD